jgi:phosphoglycerate dehydrogenase-like enzyme
VADSTIETAVFLTHPDVACWRFEERHRRRLEEAEPRLRVGIARTVEEFLASLPSARIALIWRFEESWLAEAPRLEWIVTPAAGRDLFHLGPRRGLDIDYGTFHGELMGETVAAFLLAHSRGVIATLRTGRDELWPRARLAASMRPLRGSTLTILGFGHIGEWIGRLLRPFGVRIIGVKRRRIPEPDWFVRDEDRIVLSGDLDAVLAETDFLVIVLPDEAGTRHILDARRLALLPRSAVVVNVGRGSAIDEDALASALTDGRIAAACLDVFEVEPLPADSPLRRAPNAVLMPHAAAIAPNYLDLFVEELITKIRRRYPATTE